MQRCLARVVVPTTDSDAGDLLPCEMPCISAAVEYAQLYESGDSDSSDEPPPPPPRPNRAVLASPTLSASSDGCALSDDDHSESPPPPPPPRVTADGEALDEVSPLRHRHSLRERSPSTLERVLRSATPSLKRNDSHESLSTQRDRVMSEWAEKRSRMKKEMIDFVTELGVQPEAIERAEQIYRDLQARKET